MRLFTSGLNVENLHDLMFIHPYLFYCVVCKVPEEYGR